MTKLFEYKCDEEWTEEQKEKFLFDCIQLIHRTYKKGIIDKDYLQCHLENYWDLFALLEDPYDEYITDE